jgi:hypothetical protein
MVIELREFVIVPCIWLKLKTFHLNTMRGLTPKFIWNFAKLICEKIIVKIFKNSKDKNRFKLNNFCSVGSKICEMRNLYPVSWWGFWRYQKWSWVLESLGRSWSMVCFG